MEAVPDPPSEPTSTDHPQTSDGVDLSETPTPAAPASPVEAEAAPPATPDPHQVIDALSHVQLPHKSVLETALLAYPRQMEAMTEMYTTLTARTTVLENSDKEKTTEISKLQGQVDELQKCSKIEACARYRTVHCDYPSYDTVEKHFDKVLNSAVHDPSILADVAA
jgi:hypothetical protein